MPTITGTNFNDNDTYLSTGLFLLFFPKLIGTNLADTIYGLAGNDIIEGGDGNDTIDGGTGADTMYGGRGNDLYYVDDINDLVIENSNEGTDTVYSSITYTLTTNVENLVFSGTSAINGYGNSLNNRITGNSGNNIIRSYQGNDTINGGVGADTMYGGTGNDFYYVDNINDLVIENSNEGADTVYSSITYTLSNNVENLVLTGSSAIAGYGNSLNNRITGNSGNNIIRGYEGNDTIDGGAGGDIMYGGTGNDTYYFDNINDVVVENLNEGIDTVYSSIDYLLRSYSSSIGFTMRSDPENIILTGTANITAEGSSVDNNIIGNSGSNLIYGYDGYDLLYGRDGDDSIFAGFGGGEIHGENGNDHLNGGSDIDTIFGGAGDDLIFGNGGNDILYGGAGKDYFLFLYPSEGVDIIKDFEWKEGDKILVDKLGFGASSLDEFSYDSSTGNLFFLSTKLAVIENTPFAFNPMTEIILF